MGVTISSSLLDQLLDHFCFSHFEARWLEEILEVHLANQISLIWNGNKNQRNCHLVPALPGLDEVVEEAVDEDRKCYLVVYTTCNLQVVSIIYLGKYRQAQMMGQQALRPSLVVYPVMAPTLLRFQTRIPLVVNPPARRVVQNLVGLVFPSQEYPISQQRLMDWLEWLIWYQKWPEEPASCLVKKVLI